MPYIHNYYLKFSLEWLLETIPFVHGFWYGCFLGYFSVIASSWRFYQWAGFANAGCFIDADARARCSFALGRPERYLRRYRGYRGIYLACLFGKGETRYAFSTSRRRLLQSCRSEETRKRVRKNPVWFWSAPKPLQNPSAGWLRKELVQSHRSSWGHAQLLRYIFLWPPPMLLDKLILQAVRPQQNNP